jgi:hypothetical protein
MRELPVYVVFAREAMKRLERRKFNPSSVPPDILAF